MFTMLGAWRRRKGWSIFGRPSPLQLLALVLLLIPSTLGLGAAMIEIYYDTGPYQAAAFMLGMLALVGGVAVPAATAHMAVATTSWLRRGRCLEEMLVSRLKPSQIVDGIAFSTLAATARLALWTWVALVLGAGVLITMDPATFPLVGAALWPLPVALLAVTLVYSGIAHNLATRREGETPALSYWLYLSPAPILFVLGLCVVDRHAWVGTTMVLLAGIWALFGSRSYAARNLVSSPSRRPSKKMHSAISLKPGNPLVAREMVRDQHRGWMASHPGTKVVVVLTGVLLCLSPWLGDWKAAYGMLVAGFFILANLAPFRAGLKSLDVLIREREGKTLETTVLSRLTVREVVDGAAWLGIFPRVKELLVWGGLLMLPWITEAPISFYAMLLMMSVFFTALIVTGAYMGLVAAHTAENRREAWGRFTAFVFGSAFVYQMGHAALWMLLADFPGKDPLVSLVWTCGFPLTVLFLSRHNAMKQLGHRREQAGFGRI